MASAGPDWSVLAPRWDPAGRSEEGDADTAARASQLLIVAAASAVIYGLGALADGAVT